MDINNCRFLRSLMDNDNNNEMIFFLTEIQVVNPTTHELERFAGPRIEALSISEAEQYCESEIPYCEVVGRLGFELPLYRMN